MAVKWVRGVQARMFKSTLQIGIEDWIPILSTQYSNTWTANSGNLSEVPAYYKDALGVVWLKGRLERGAGGADNEIILTMPAGYRPPHRRRFTVVTGPNTTATYATVTANADGTITVNDIASVVIGHLSLDGVTYRSQVDDK